jgi:N-acetylglutamate synthase-like GNAT family acetyltransferase
MEIKIEHLEKHKEAIPQIAAWLHAQWGHLMPGVAPEDLVSTFWGRLTPHQIPETFVALADGQVVGTASLVAHDMSIRMELSPWLAAVYIHSDYRGQGIGSKLVQAVMDETAEMGLPRFYLFTPDRAPFYARLGWQALEETNYRGEHVTVMVYEAK